jgi:hypothetical protein
LAQARRRHQKKKFGNLIPIAGKAGIVAREAGTTSGTNVEGESPYNDLK